MKSGLELDKYGGRCWLKQCTTWELWAKFYLRQSENCSPGDSTSDSPKRLLQRGSAAAAAAKSLQSCPTLCDPIDSSPQAPPSLGFSRQEHWSGLPFPSPMHESEKWKWSRSVATPWTTAYQAPLSVGFSRQEYLGRSICRFRWRVMQSSI